MASLLVGTLLVGSIVLVHFSTRRRPLPSERPLDVDEKLPFPAAGQGSTVFSLTALFGAYFGIFLVLGFPAVFGLIAGTTLALFMIRAATKAGLGRYEDFLVSRLGTDIGNKKALSLILTATQLAYATSELLILREICVLSLGVRPHHATIIATGLAVIAYFYVLFGGYDAVFRTDILQFAFVMVMAVALFMIPLLSFYAGPPIRSQAAWPRPGYWEFPEIFHLRFLYHFLIGAIMGLGFLLASPDTWKRVFTVTRSSKRMYEGFAALLLAGAVPFALLTPLALATDVPDGPVTSMNMFNHILSNDWLFVVVLLGMVASFLSSFDSAFISAVHIGLLQQRRPKPDAEELTRFHWLMGAGLVAISLIFIALLQLGNPYYLANLLMGPFALLGGVILGTRGSLLRLRPRILPWLGTLGLTFWFVYVSSLPEIISSPNTYQINTVPVGALLFLVSATICLIARRRVD